ncbi:MAG: tRNA 2-thiocytidine(32) synthetase TtcA [Deltaproteobacteria bacterium]|nr:tRNA 2-thiocytidine(32) synthetase TtcA [Deltaproteobacteria bacterium]
MEVPPQKRSKLFHHLKKWLEKAIIDYAMISKGDRVLLAFSGGADSHALLDLMMAKMVFVPPFELIACHIDNGFDESLEGYQKIEEYFRYRNILFVMEKTDFGRLAHSDYNFKKSACFLCSRLRRKRLFEIAAANNCNKIALGHHRDDVVETLILNMFYSREISTMVPNQPLFGGTLNIIRPFFYIREELVKKFAVECAFPIIANPCPTAPISRRAYIKNLLQELETENRAIRNNIFKSLSHVRVEYLIGEKNGEQG